MVCDRNPLRWSVLMVKRVKKKEGTKRPGGPDKLPGNPRVDPISNIERHMLYKDREVRVVAYRGNKGDINRSQTRGIGVVVQYCTKGRYTYEWNDQKARSLKAGDHRDTFGQTGDGVWINYTIDRDDTEFLCISCYNRARFPYEILRVKKGSKVSVIGPGPGERDHLVVVLRGSIVWRDDDDGDIDTQEALDEVIEVSVGEDGEARATVDSEILVIK